MGRKGIAGFAVFLLAAGALAWSARQWQKSKRSKQTEAIVTVALPARKAESASPAAIVNAPLTPAAAPSPAGVTTPQAAGPGSSPNRPDGGPPIEDTKSAGEKPGWKTYTSAEYGFEIQYPSDWLFNADYENNKGKPPSGHRPAGYAGETRNLFRLEIEGADQPREGGGDFEDGAVVDVKVTGTNGVLETWGLKPGQPWYLITSTPEEWLKSESTMFGGNHLEFISIETNGFTGRVEVAHDDSNPEKVWGEIGGAYRILPGGRVLLISWNRMNIANALSYRKYFLPMLSSFRLLPEKPAK